MKKGPISSRQLLNSHLSRALALQLLACMIQQEQWCLPTGVSSVLWFFWLHGEYFIFALSSFSWSPTLFFKLTRIAYQKKLAVDWHHFIPRFSFLWSHASSLECSFYLGKKDLKDSARNWMCKKIVILCITESASEHHFRARLEIERDHILHVSGWHTSFRPLSHDTVSISPDFPAPPLIKQQGSFFLAL